MSLLILIPVVIVVSIILLIAAVRGSSEEGGGEKMIKNVYVYLVLFATLMMVIGGSVAAFMAVADIAVPTSYVQTFEDYKQWKNREKMELEGEGKVELSEAEMRKNYDAMVLSEEEKTIVRAKNKLIKSFGWIVIPLPIFIFFQRRLIRKEV